MNGRQRHILHVLSSVCVGNMGFCLTLPVTLILGSILLALLGRMDREGFLPPEFVVLFLISTLVGLSVAIFVGMKYHHYRRIDK